MCYYCVVYTQIIKFVTFPKILNISNVAAGVILIFFVFINFQNNYKYRVTDSKAGIFLKPWKTSTMSWKFLKYAMFAHLCGMAAKYLKFSGSVDFTILWGRL